MKENKKFVLQPYILDLIEEKSPNHLQNLFKTSIKTDKKLNDYSNDYLKKQNRYLIENFIKKLEIIFFKRKNNNFQFLKNKVINENYIKKFNLIIKLNKKNKRKSFYAIMKLKANSLRSKNFEKAKSYRSYLIINFLHRKIKKTKKNALSMIKNHESSHKIFNLTNNEFPSSNIRSFNKINDFSFEKDSDKNFNKFNLVPRQINPQMDKNLDQKMLIEQKRKDSEKIINNLTDEKKEMLNQFFKKAKKLSQSSFKTQDDKEYINHDFYMKNSFDKNSSNKRSIRSQNSDSTYKKYSLIKSWIRDKKELSCMDKDNLIESMENSSISLNKKNKKIPNNKFFSKLKKKVFNKCYDNTKIKKRNNDCKSSSGKKRKRNSSKSPQKKKRSKSPNKKNRSKSPKKRKSLKTPKKDKVRGKLTIK